MEFQWPGELILSDIPYGHTEGPQKKKKGIIFVM